MTVSGTRINPSGLYASGRSVEFSANFSGISGSGFQHVGFGNTFGQTPWMMFSTFTGGGIWARTNDGVFPAIDTPIAGTWLNALHRYRIDWNAANVVYWIDGVVVATHVRTVTGTLRPIISDFDVAGGTLSVDWLRMTPYTSPSTFQSRVFDAGSAAIWTTATWTATEPAGTSVVISVRRGDTAVPDASWTAFAPLAGSGAAIGGTSRYIQYRAVLTSSAAGQTPALSDVTLSGTSP